MAKKMKRFLATLTALCLCAGHFSVAARAAETEQDPLTASVELVYSAPVTDTTTSTDELGNVTTVDTTQQSWTGEGTEEDTTVLVEGSETVTQTTTKDDVGNVITESGSTEGAESSVTTTVETQQDTTQETLPPETTDNDFVPGQTQEGQWSEPEEVESPSVTTEDAEISHQPDSVTLNMSQDDPTDEVKEEGDLTVVVQENGLYTGETETTVTGTPTDPDGEIKVVREPLLDEAGNVIGYKTTTTTTKTVETEGDPTTSEGTPVTGEPVVGETVTTPGSTETSFTLPEKPAESETTDESGNKTTVTVEEILEDGTVVGYKSITVVTDAEGTELSRSSESVYGTTKTTEVSNETTETTTVTTTDIATNKTVTTTTTVVTDAEGRELVPVITDGTFWGWAYKGELGEVTASSEHGNVEMTSLTPTQAEPAVGTVDKTTDLYNRQDSNVAGEYGDYSFQWTGKYGLESAIRVEAGDVTTWQPHQFVLDGADGEEYYVYCADFEVSPELTFRYTMENLEDADYYDSDAAKKIRAIAMNGYWGTSEGTGSLAAVQELMRESGLFSTSEIDSLTPGEALTATQAAIWKYGNSGTTKFDDTDIVGAYYNGGYSFNYGYSNDTVQRLYDYLITLSEDPTDSTTLINQNNFATQASITVLDKVENVQANQDTDPDNDVYNTNVSFSLLVQPDTESDDLVVTVLDGNGNVLRKARLAGDGTEDGSEFGTATRDGDMYTISGLQIAEGVNITLNLSGTQHLDQGVYLYTSEIRGTTSSQTFVGLAEGEQTVDLSVDLKFEVTDPQATIENTTSVLSTSKTDTREDTKTDTRTETEVKTNITVTTTVTEETHRQWDSQWAKEYTYEYDTDLNEDDFGDEEEEEEDEDDEDEEEQKDDDGEETTEDENTEDETTDDETNEDETTEDENVEDESTEDNGGNEEKKDDDHHTFETNSDDGLIVIEDEDVALADAPKTGDISALWAVLALASAGGMVMLKKREED